MKTKMILKMILLVSAAIVSIAVAGCEKHAETGSQTPAPSTQPPVPPAPTNNPSGATAPMPGTSGEKPADVTPAPPDTNAVPNP